MQQKRNTEYFKKLLQRYKNNTCKPDEVRELFKIVQSGKGDTLIDAELREEFNRMFHSDEQTKELPSKIFRLSSFRRFAIAAAASVAILFGLYVFIFQQNSEKNNSSIAGRQEEMMPNQKQVVLTMDNGQQVIFDSTTNGQIAVLSGTVISLNEKGELIYDASKAGEGEKTRMNTVSTPTGGFFKIVLADGTNVWLNSESELTFPSKFPGKERAISLKGEGYFEVAENTNKPFKVKLNGGEEITVLGTTFNVMTYKNEPVQKVTLLEGRINLSNQSNNKTLKPGQQAVISNGEMEINNDAVIDHEIAWKNGLFDFQNDDLPTIMRQISRWYNVEIVTNGSKNSGHFTGSMRKSAGISEVLKMLEVAGDVRFAIVGNKIIINDIK